MRRKAYCSFSRFWLFFGLVTLTLAGISVAADIGSVWDSHKIHSGSSKVWKGMGILYKDGTWIEGEPNASGRGFDGHTSDGKWRMSGSTIILTSTYSDRTERVYIVFNISAGGREMTGTRDVMFNNTVTEKWTLREGAPPTGKTTDKDDTPTREKNDSEAGERMTEAGERMTRENSERLAREQRERAMLQNAERLTREHQERMARAQEEAARREQEGKEADERVNGMSAERFLKQAREMENGTRPAPAKDLTAKEMRRFDASATGRTREEALAKLHEQHIHRRKQDPTATELTNIEVKSSVMKGPKIVKLQGGKLKKVKDTWERVDWYAGGEYLRAVSEPQSASRQ